MKTIKIEVIDGSIHDGDKVYTKGDVFEIDEKFAKNLIESKVAKEVVAEVKAKNTLPTSNVETKTNDAKTKDNQAEVFGKIDEDLNEKKSKK